MKNIENDEEFDDDISKSEILAERLLRRCHVHDFDSGGILSLITGGMGSAKTSVMLSFVDYTLNHYREEKVFWSNTYYAPIQSLRIGMDKHHIMVKQNSDVTFHDRKQRLKQIYPKITEFNSFDDLYDKAKPGFLNCVFFGSRNIWMDFVHYLRGINDRLFEFGSEIEVIPIALTMEQVKKYNPPPNPAKITDSRAKEYIATYGRTSWEVDALPPDVMIDLVNSKIKEYVDIEKMEQVKKQEKEDMKQLEEFAEKLGGSANE